MRTAIRSATRGACSARRSSRRWSNSSLDFYLTASRFTEAFEAAFADYLGLSDALFVNSGSSANLVALTALTSPKLGDRRLQPGDEVITVAAGFPSTVAPIIQNGLVPVFVDVRLGDYNADPEQLRAAVSPRTRAIMLAHTLGAPFDLDTVMDLVREHDLWLVEDNCDALGARYRGRLTGTFGHLATSSFYPAHHITTGEGGMVVTDDEALARIARSIRDWGRDCYCAGGENNTCGKRFAQQFGSLPFGYDHKYVYSHLGYNLKATDMQAAIGSVQLGRLDGFVAARKRNHARLLEALRPYEDRLLLPAAGSGADPSWFAFVVTVREDAGFTRSRPGGVPRGQAGRDTEPVQRQPAAPSRRSNPSSVAWSAICRTPTPSRTGRSSWACTRASTTRGWTTSPTSSAASWTASDERRATARAGSRRRLSRRGRQPQAAMRGSLGDRSR